MNKVIFTGRLTRDPEIRYSQTDKSTSVAKFSIAVDRRFKRQDDQAGTDFFSCAAFGRQAEFAEKYLKKGTKILLEGRIQNDNYTNARGERVYGVGVIVESLEFAESKRASEEHERAGSGTQPAQADDGFIHVPDDDDGLPFT